MGSFEAGGVTVWGDWVGLMAVGRGRKGVSVGANCGGRVITKAGALGVGMVGFDLVGVGIW